MSREDSELQYEVQDDLLESPCQVDRVLHQHLGTVVLGGDVPVLAGDVAEPRRGRCYVQDVLGERDAAGFLEPDPYVHGAGSRAVVGVDVGIDVLRDVRVGRCQHAVERIQSAEAEGAALYVQLQVALVQLDLPVTLGGLLGFQGSRTDQVADLRAGDDLRRLDEYRLVVNRQQLELGLVAVRLCDAERQVGVAHDLEALVLLALRQEEGQAHARLFVEPGTRAAPRVVPEEVANGAERVVQGLHAEREVVRQEDGGVVALVAERVGLADEVQAKFFDGSHNPLPSL